MEKRQKEERNKDRQTKIVHVKQNKLSLCGKIPAGLLPPTQLVTVDPRRAALLGSYNMTAKEETQQASGASKHNTNRASTVT